MRAIPLQSDGIRHGVQLITGQYVVCHNGWFTPHGVCRYGVCIVDDHGSVTRRYGGHPVPLRNEPSCLTHLAVDKDSQFIFAADCRSNRVVLLSPTLEFVRCLDKCGSRSHQQRLHFDHTTRRLYVGRRYRNELLFPFFWISSDYEAIQL